MLACVVQEQIGLIEYFKRYWIEWYCFPIVLVPKDLKFGTEKVYACT